MLGLDEAGTLMELLPPNGWDDIATKELVAANATSLRGEMAEVRVLRELGLELDDDLAVRVWETSAETRYMVIPLRPLGTEGLTEAELAQLVTREALIGVAVAGQPDP